MAIGLLALGQVSVGFVLGIGQLAIGWLAVGQGALGLLFAVGQLAVGYVAIGQLAAGTYALAQVAWGDHIVDMRTVDPAAKDFFLGLIGR